MNREDRVSMFRARLAGREGLAHEIELQAGWDELAPAPDPPPKLVGDSDAGKGRSVEPPDPGTPLIFLAAEARALWGH